MPSPGRRANADAGFAEIGRFALSENHTPNIGLLSTVAIPVPDIASALRSYVWPFMVKKGPKTGAAPFFESGGCGQLEPSDTEGRNG
jgi:hypothetical protein